MNYLFAENEELAQRFAETFADAFDTVTNLKDGIGRWFTMQDTVHVVGNVDRSVIADIFRFSGGAFNKPTIVRYDSDLKTGPKWTI